MEEYLFTQVFPTDFLISNPTTNNSQNTSVSVPISNSHTQVRNENSTINPPNSSNLPSSSNSSNLRLSSNVSITNLLSPNPSSDLQSTTTSSNPSQQVPSTTSTTSSSTTPPSMQPSDNQTSSPSNPTSTNSNNQSNVDTNTMMASTNTSPSSTQRNSISNASIPNLNLERPITVRSEEKIVPLDLRNFESNIFANHKFGILGKFKRWSHFDIERIINSNGGRVVPHPTSGNCFLIISQLIIEGNFSSKKCKSFKSVPFVTLDFLIDSIQQRRILDYKQYMVSYPTTENLPPAKRPRLETCTHTFIVNTIKSIDRFIQKKKFNDAVRLAMSLYAEILNKTGDDEFMKLKSTFYAFYALARLYAIESKIADESTLPSVSKMIDDALLIFPKTHIAYFAKGKYLYCNGQFKLANRQFETFKSIAPNISPYLAEADYLMERCEVFNLIREMSTLDEDSMNFGKLLNVRRAAVFDVARLRKKVQSIFIKGIADKIVKGSSLLNLSEEDLVTQIALRVRKKINLAKEENDLIQVQVGNSNAFTGICPITNAKIVNPLRSLCNHVFEREGIMFLLRGRQFTICPVFGCQKMIQASDLVYDAKSAELLKSIQDEEDDEEFETNLSNIPSSNHSNVIVLSDDD